MTSLVIAEHNNQSLNVATLNAVAAAAQIPGDVHVLVVGHGCDAVVQAAAQVAGVAKVLAADAPHYAHALAENLAPLVAGLAGAYSHLLVAATTSGKNVMPRVAALLDVMQVSEITRVLAPDTFERPIYAGNALQTVQSTQGFEGGRSTDEDTVAREDDGRCGTGRREQVACAGRIQGEATGPDQANPCVDELRIGVREGERKLSDAGEQQEGIGSPEDQGGPRFLAERGRRQRDLARQDPDGLLDHRGHREHDQLLRREPAEPCG
jgi:hypothetical protein